MLIEVARWCASAHVQSTMEVKETGQHTSQDNEDIPGTPHDLHPPSTNPVKTTRPPDETLSVELEGERICIASFDDGLTSSDADAMGVSSCVEDCKNSRRGDSK